MSLIEEGRQNLEARERITQACKEFFTSARDILKTDGVPMKNYLVLRYIGAHYKLGNTEQPIDVLVGSSRMNLDKSKEFGIKVEGVGDLYVKRTGKEGKERFQVKEYKIGSRNAWDLSGNSNPNYDERRVQDYLATLRRVKVLSSYPRNK